MYGVLVFFPVSLSSSVFYAITDSVSATKKKNCPKPIRTFSYQNVIVNNKETAWHCSLQVSSAGILRGQSHGLGRSEIVYKALIKSGYKTPYLGLFYKKHI